jgi:antirestriction protein ArdC
LNRRADEPPSEFGSPAYSKEELVAEFGDALLCAHAGILPAVQANSAAYIRGWWKYLQHREFALWFAISQAQAAADFILGEPSRSERRRRRPANKS